MNTVDQEMDRWLTAEIGARRGGVAGSRPAVRPAKSSDIVDMQRTGTIVDNRTISDICLQHLVAMMIVDAARRSTAFTTTPS